MLSHKEFLINQNNSKVNKTIREYHKLEINQRNKQLDLLYDKYYDSIFERCFYYVNRKPIYFELVEDCVQDAFVKAIEHYDEFKDYRNPAGWIANAAYNNLRSNLKKLRRRARVTSSLSSFNVEAVTFSINSLDTEIERRETIEMIVKIFDMLTEHEKTVFFPYFVDNLSIKSTADETGLSENSVRAAVNRIRKRARSANIQNFLFLIGCLFCFWHTI